MTCLVVIYFELLIPVGKLYWINRSPLMSCTTGLKKYLKEVGIDAGETPHGIRGWCAITLSLSSGSTEDIMSHIGWTTKSSYLRYSRMNRMLSSDSLMSAVSEDLFQCESTYSAIGDVSALNNAF